LIHNTDLLQWSSMEMAPFDGGLVILHNTNRLVGHFDGCDGLKTGFTIKAGFNLTATAKRGEMRLVSVILGAPSNPERFIQTARLLNWGFDNFAKVQVLSRGEPLPVHVRAVSDGSLFQPVSQSDVALVVRKSEMPDLKLEFNVPETLSGPVVFGEPVGQVMVLNGAEILTKVGAICPIGTREQANQPMVTTSPSSGGSIGIIRAAAASVAGIPDTAGTAPASAQAMQEGR